ncbi:hypothetical protein BCR34DRAFT_474314 [Clohesyomyces aquaticus]|uniref:Cyclin-D1-binding protein 1-like N-terminal domain-containing protein n=1 Tax=Clohesyomyces aquaticus TaxID=1231657 RepID=A0A1Y2A5Q8_9PLEO|nr:hypothetical protein BCR34DRAFT_474314 [Clohesyomyces aquaticus]
MPPKPPTTPPSRDLTTLIELTRSSQTLLTHFQSSLSPTPPTTTTTTPSSSSLPTPASTLTTLKTTTTLLKSHTTTLSLLLLTPPLTPSAISKKLGDVTSGVLSGMVAAATTESERELGEFMRSELISHVRRILRAWEDVLSTILKIAEGRRGDVKGAVTEGEKQDVLNATGMVWESCDALLSLCTSGFISHIVQKAEAWRATLLDAVQELGEWGEDEDDDDDATGSDDGGGEFGDEDDIFGAANKLGKGDEKLKELLERGTRKLKKVGLLYQAVGKRRLKTFPFPGSPTQPADTGRTITPTRTPLQTLDALLTILKDIPELVDDLASAFYDLDESEARQILEKCCAEAKKAVGLVRKGWDGNDDAFTTWSGKWVEALDADGP